MPLAFPRWPGLVLLVTALVVVPASSGAFSAPKTWLLAGAAAISLVLAVRSRRRAEVLAPALACAGVTVASALVGDSVLPQAAVLQVTGAVLLVAWTVTGVDVARTLPVVAAAGASVALIALLQALGVDPLASFGPAFAGERLRVYGTLGNPDFVAALLVPTLVVTLSLGASASSSRARLLLGAGVVLHLGALVAARSFGSLLALLAAAAVFFAFSRAPLATGRRRGLLLLLLSALGVASALVPRDLGRTLSGRVYLARIALPHLAEAPLLGHGPGAVEARFASWEAGAWASGAMASADQRFAGRQNHLHDDLLERALEQGLAGLAALAVVLVAALRRLWKRAAPHSAALAAALVALLVRSLVDFPLARPAELCLFVLLLAASLSPAALEDSP